MQIQAGSLADFDDGLQFKFATVRTNAGDEYTGQIIGVCISFLIYDDDCHVFKGLQRSPLHVEPLPLLHPRPLCLL